MGKSFLRPIKSTISSPIFGVIGSVIGVAWDAFWLIGPPISINPGERKQFLVWGFVALVVCVFQAFLGFQQRVSDLQHELRQVRARVGRPSLTVTYDSPALYGLRDPHRDAPLDIHNAGPRAALNITSEPIVFNENCKVCIKPIQMIGPYAKTAARFEVEWKFDDGGRLLETPDHFGEAIFQADLVNIDKALTRGGPWDLVFRYVDDEGQQFMTTYEVALDLATKRVRLTFRPPSLMSASHAVAH